MAVELVEHLVGHRTSSPSCGEQQARARTRRRRSTVTPIASGRRSAGRAGRSAPTRREAPARVPAGEHVADHPEPEDDRRRRRRRSARSRCSVSPRITMSPQPKMARPLRFHARSVRSSADDGARRRTRRLNVARSLDDHQHEPEHRDDRHDDRHDQRQPRAGQRPVVADRVLVAVPLPVAHRRDDDAERDERQADEPAAAREVERRQQLRDREPGGDEAERGPLPGQEGALVGERELDVGFGRRETRGRPSPPIMARPPSMTAVSVGDRGVTGPSKGPARRRYRARSRPSPTASNAASTPARCSTSRSTASRSPTSPSAKPAPACR